MSVTCAICETSVILIPDGVVRYCKCKFLGVDHTNEYTMYIGTVPKEDPGFEKWWQDKSELCLKYREKLRY